MVVEALNERLYAGENVFMDGATGTEVAARGIKLVRPLWSATALLSKQGQRTTFDVHHEYIMAGAQIIETNSFRIHKRIFDMVGIGELAGESTIKACDLAHEAREISGRPEVVIAGSVGPLEDCYTPAATPSQAELEYEHPLQAEALAKGGVDMIWAETMITIREAKAALAAAQQTGLPVAVSFCTDDSGSRLLSGEPLARAVELAAEFNPVSVGVNCVSMDVATRAVRHLVSLKNGIPINVYAQGDDPESPKHKPHVDYETAYPIEARKWALLGAQIIGGCCGVSPIDIRNIRRAVSGVAVSIEAARR